MIRSILRKHSMITFNKQPVSQRRYGFPLRLTVSCMTAFAKRQFNGLRTRLYSKAYKQLNICTLSEYEVNKTKTYSWLQMLTYSDTEELLTAVNWSEIRLLH